MECVINPLENGNRTSSRKKDKQLLKVQTVQELLIAFNPESNHLKNREAKKKIQTSQTALDPLAVWHINAIIMKFAFGPARFFTEMKEEKN